MLRVLLGVSVFVSDKFLGLDSGIELVILSILDFYIYIYIFFFNDSSEFDSNCKYQLTMLAPGSCTKDSPLVDR
jgi:hypothetical protein